MKKVIVIGCPGSGKSTFSRELHNKTALPLYHLDMMYWNEDKTTIEKSVFLERLNDAMAGDEWIIDGNYGATMEMRMSACDTVFFLDYPKDVCIEGAKKRMGQKRSDIPWVEEEIDEEFLSFIESYNEESRPKVLELLQKYSDKDIIIFRKREEADAFLLCIKASGKTYYVSNSGSDKNDGKSKNTPIKSLEKLETMPIECGDEVLFERGSIFRGEVPIHAGVTYSAYGKGDKPAFYGWDENLADSSLWEKEEDGIWRYKKTIPEVGTLVFEGESVSRKLIPSYRYGKFVCRENEDKDFVFKNEATENLDIYWHFEEKLIDGESKGESFPVPDVNGTYGTLYLRCDEGNPGEVFYSIEAVVRRIAFNVTNKNNVTVDNLCLKYYCFGVQGAGRIKGLTVTNCEIGWIGGNIQHYSGTDPNFPEGKRGSVTRYGNGVEIYGGCDGYRVENCHIYQSYDAGITHQVNAPHKFEMKNISYSNNLIEKCVYGIEYFLDILPGGEESFMENVKIEGNIIKDTGFGWGQQRHNKETPAAIKGWSYENTARNFTIKNNVFDRSAYRLLHLVAKKEEYLPKLSGNSYIQNRGGMLGQFGANEVSEPSVIMFCDAENAIKNIFGDANAKIAFK